MYRAEPGLPRFAPMQRHAFARPETPSFPAASAAALGLLARLSRGPVPLAELRDRDNGLRALAVAQARGLARLALDAAGTAYVLPGRGGR
jgi:hypothetical protein